jgi:hypothetical protein
VTGYVSFYPACLSSLIAHKVTVRALVAHDSGPKQLITSKHTYKQQLRAHSWKIQ